MGTSQRTSAPRSQQQSGGQAPVRHGHGVAVIVLLAIIFLILVTLLVLYAGKRHPGSEVARAETLSVVPIRIRVRTQPSANAPVVFSAEGGDRLTMLEDRGAWARVQNGEGLSGWAERSGLERTAEREKRLARFAAIRKLPALDGIVGRRTPLYAGPGIFYPLVGELARDLRVRVFTRDHDFYAVEEGDTIAYVDVDAVDVSASGRQLDVSSQQPPATSSEPLPMATDTTASTASMPPLGETAAPVPPPLPETPATPPSAVPDQNQTGVYAAVPVGGTQPEEIYRPVPVYPAMARRAGAGGSAVIRGIVRRDGSIDEVEIIKDLPYGLGDAARDAVRRWRFRPATFHGEPIDVYYTVTVNFRLTS